MGAGAWVLALSTKLRNHRVRHRLRPTVGLGLRDSEWASHSHMFRAGDWQENGRLQGHSISPTGSPFMATDLNLQN